MLNEAYPICIVLMIGVNFMSSPTLGTLAELPADYLSALEKVNTAPAWPSLRSLIPEGAPDHKTLAHHWKYKELHPLLLRAGDLTPMDRAERRVLMLANPGLDKPFATASIFFGLQLILPGEVAPNHRHSASAVRLIIEGEGAFTTVEGQRCEMHRGDVILTPAHLWHEHEHRGSGPMAWLDALDVPVMLAMEAVYGEPGALQQHNNRPDSSQTCYRRAGLLPYNRLGKQANSYPQFRFPWNEVRSALIDLSKDTPPGEPIQLAYVNPETGLSCMPTLGFSALMIRPGEEVNMPPDTASRGYLVIEGRGKTYLADGKEFSWEESDVLAFPTHSRIRHANASNSAPAFLIQVDDAPMQRHLGFYEALV